MRRLGFLTWAACAVLGFGCGTDDPAVDGTGADATSATGDTGTAGTADTGPDTSDTGPDTTDTEDSGTTDTGPDTSDTGPDTTDTEDSGTTDTEDSGTTDTEDSGTTDTEDSGTGTGDTGTGTGDPIDPCEVDPDGVDCCEQTEGCAALEVFLVCDELSGQDYLNDCFAKCDKGNYDNLSGYDGSCCEDGSCELSCDPDQSESNPVCWVDPLDGANVQKYANLYLACLDGHPYPDPNLVGATLVDGEVVCPGGEDACLECTDEPSPLCGKLGETFTSYVNSCWFDCSAEAGETIECDAPCAESQQCPQCVADGCAPVCGEDGNTYRNGCYAVCAGGVSVEHPGACCNCPDGGPGDAWCSKEGNTFETSCDLVCAGETPDYNQKCITGCTAQAGDVKVCANQGGSFVTYPNAACAQADGATCVYEGDCAWGTNHCVDNGETQYAPVCATYLDPNTGVEKTGTFPNACHAGCAGASEITAGLCAACQDLCSTALAGDFCGKDDCVMYPNSCVPTKCAGIAQENLTKFACIPECGQ